VKINHDQIADIHEYSDSQPSRLIRNKDYEPHHSLFAVECFRKVDRFIRTQNGQYMDDVYAKVCRDYDRRTDVGKYVRKCFKMMVDCAGFIVNEQGRLEKRPI
jgi:hypothetical protein